MSSIYVMEQGSVLKKSGERLLVIVKNITLFERHFRDIDRILIFGNIQITTQVLNKVFYEGIDLSYFSMQGYFRGQVISNRSKNVYIKIAQITYWKEENFSLELAILTVKYKIQAQLAVLKKRRRGVTLKDEELVKVINELEIGLNTLSSITTITKLRGVEGNCARAYFSCWDRLLPKDFPFEKRSKRPALNEMNSALNFSYTLLLNEVNSLLESYGFDVMLGYYHSIRYGRISLSLDVMEILRPLLVDQWLIKIARSKELMKSDFYKNDKGIYLSTDGRKKFLTLYQKWQKDSKYRENVEHLVESLRHTYMEGKTNEFRAAAKKILSNLL